MYLYETELYLYINLYVIIKSEYEDKHQKFYIRLR